MPRTQQHVRETVSRDMVRRMIDAFYENGDALIREWTERDYGIDYLLELFDNGTPTGKLAFLQIKGTGMTIEKLRRSEEVSCPGVSISSLEYAKQKRIPFVLIYASSENLFYYIDLQSIVSKVFDKITGESQRKTTTIRIPIMNCTYESNLSGFFDLINSYYLTK